MARATAQGCSEQLAGALVFHQIFTRPYTPKTNGKAERFIQTCLREWAYARAYQNSDQRSAELVHWLIATIGIGRMVV